MSKVDLLISMISKLVEGDEDEDATETQTAQTVATEGKRAERKTAQDKAGKAGAVAKGKARFFDAAEYESNNGRILRDVGILRPDGGWRVSQAGGWRKGEALTVASEVTMAIVDTLRIALAEKRIEQAINELRDAAALARASREKAAEDREPRREYRRVT